MLKVLCKECIKESYPVQIGKQLSEIKKNISIQIKDLSDRFESMKTNYVAKQDETINAIQSHNTEAKVSWANTVKMGLESSQSIKAVRDEVKVAGSKNLELKEKDRSIVMFNHPESKKTNSAERKKDDLTFIEKFIDEGLNISAQPVQSCFRLGRYNENKNRPMKVIFCQKVGQVKVMENLSSLRGASEDYNKVSVCIDRDAAERKVVQELVQKAKEQTTNSTNKRYVVRGAFNPYIQEQNKPTA